MSGPTSLVTRVTRLASGGVFVALAVVGLLTAASLTVSEVRSLDLALAAAAHARAAQPRFGRGERWLPHEHGAGIAVAVWPDEAVPADPERLREQRAVETDAWWTEGERRFVAVTTHRQGAPVEGLPLSAHPHAVVVAWAPRARPWAVIGTFLAFYVPLSLVVAGLVAWAQGRAVRAELVPLDAAIRELEGVARLGAVATIAEAGPTEVRALIAAVNALLARLDAAHGAQASFVATAVHELRTPVAVLSGEIELLLRRERPAVELRAGVERLQDDVRRLARVVDALLALARVDAGEVHRARQPERASALIHGALRGHVDPAWAGQVEADPGPDPEIRVHVALVEMALGNLVRNAFVHGHPPVRVAVSVEAGRAVFRVSDAGAGVAPEERERVFERFERGRVGGLGLGLPLAREVARQHGGDCAFEGPTSVVALALPA